MDALNYVRWSELHNSGDERKGVIIPNSTLLNNPAAVLGLGSDITVESRLRDNDRWLNPLADVPQRDGNWARHGWDWADVLKLRNVGLYGHVVPFRDQASQTSFLRCAPSGDIETNRDFVLCDIDLNPQQRKTYYKIEYWQFFGYNGVDKPFDLGDHEGDWTSVRVIVNTDTLQPVQVHHFVHGYRLGFDIPRAQLRVRRELLLAGHLAGSRGQRKVDAEFPEQRPADDAGPGHR